MLTEDWSILTDTSGGLAIAATLDGASVTGFFDLSTIDASTGEVLTKTPIFRGLAADLGEPVAGTELVANGATYLVRAVRRLPPDGLFTELTLSRST